MLVAKFAYSIYPHKKDPATSRTQIKILTKKELEHKLKAKMKEEKVTDRDVSRLKKDQR